MTSAEQHKHCMGGFAVAQCRNAPGVNLLSSRRKSLPYTEQEAIMSSIIETKHARPSFLLGAVLIGMAAAAIGQSAPAHASLPNKHDGRWSIEVITEKGDCDRAYRYSVLVENGAARYAGSEPITVSGRVASNGAVNGSIAYGDNRANVTGKLADGTGAGRWSWSGSRTCSGNWNAERRG
jgi:hypothetical protein